MNGMLIIGATLILVTQAPKDEAVAAGRALWLTGQYEEALEKLEALPASPTTAVWMARCLRSVGKLPAADGKLQSALKDHANDASLWAEVADLELYRGNHNEARAAISKALAADDKNLLARWTQVRLSVLTGKLDEANQQAEWFIHHYNQAQPTDPETLLYIAQASAEHARWNKGHDQFDFLISDLIPDMIKEDESYWPAKHLAGSIFLEKYNQTEGVPELQAALKINASCVEALVGLGQSALQRLDFDAVKESVTEALDINPHDPAALRLQADAAFYEEKMPDAIAALEKALQTNATDEETLGRLAACKVVLGEPAVVAELLEKIKRYDPKPARFHLELAELLERRRKYDLAEHHFKEAIKHHPFQATAMNGLGMLYMKLGREQEARDVFADARQWDPYHVRVLNMVKVLNHLDNYDTITTDHFEVVSQPKSDPLLGRYVSRFLEREHDRLCKLFDEFPKEKTRIEIMVDHKWFSARVVGLPSIHTVGACTGRAVALASPTSLNSPYNWRRVLMHEFTHVLTLRRTDDNIPHWYTEALAVYSEDSPRPQTWNELLAERIPKNDIIPIEKLNHAFARPKSALDWQMAYCQSYLCALYMKENWSERKLIELMDAYRANLDTPTAIRKVFEISLEEFEVGYRQSLKKLAAGLKKPRTEPAHKFAEAERLHRASPDNLDLAAELAWHYLLRKGAISARELAENVIEKNDKHPIARYVLARLELTIGKVKEAIAQLEPGLDKENPEEVVLDLLAGLYVKKEEHAKAIELYEIARKAEPYRQKWLEGLAKSYLLQKDNEKLEPILQELATMDSDNKTVRKKLTALAKEKKDWAGVAKWAEEILYVDINDDPAHLDLAEAALEMKDYIRSAEEYDALALLHPKEHQWRVESAKSYRSAGKLELARNQLERILKVDPNHADAKKLQAELANQ